MENLWQIALIGTLAGVCGTGFGGLVTVLFGKPKKSILSFVLAFSSGIMLAVVFEDLIPESVALGTMWSTFLGLLLGIFLLAALDRHLPHFHFSMIAHNDKRSRFIRTSILLGIGIAMHNLPEGLAIGAGYIGSEHLGLSLALVLALHNIPEGMAMAGPMKAAKVNPWQVFTWTGLAGLPMGIGALAGALFGSVSRLFLSTALGFAAGAMLYIVFNELLPDAQEMNRGYSATTGAVAGVMVGLFILMILP